MKVCRHCGESKPPAEFRRNPRMKDGLSSWCSACHNAATKRWRDEHRDEINERRRVVPAYVYDRPAGMPVPNPSPRPKSKVR
jgi:hypothetical protein